MPEKQKGEKRKEVPLEGVDTKMILVGDERWSTYGTFNLNAFPEELQPNVEACSTRAAIHLVQLNMVKEAVKKNYNDFQKELENKFTDKTVTSLKDSNIDSMVVYYDGIDYLTAFHGFLISLKSFLDVYSLLICKAIQPSLEGIFFNAKTIGDKKISGGRVISWLKDSAPKSFINSLKLQKVIENHSNNWITDAVNYRDTLSHRGDIKGMKHMHVDLKTPSYKYGDIIFPLMPDNQLVVDYCSELLSKLREFVEESMILLPNIEMKHITFTNFLILGHKNS